MKSHQLFALVLIHLPLVACKSSSELDAYAEEVCACTNQACAKKAHDKYAKLPELSMKLKDAESLPPEKQAALSKAMGCSLKLQTSTSEEGAEPKPAEKPELAAHTNDAMGYTIKLPSGFETSHEDGNAGMYGYDTMMIKVDPVGVALATPDDLLRGVNTGDGKVEKKTEGDVVIVTVEKPKMPINIYAGPVGAKFAAHCMAEPSMKALATEVCTSLRAKGGK